VLLRLYGPLTPVQRRRISSRNADLVQLIPRPTACSQQDLGLAAARHLEQSALAASSNEEDVPLLLPGLTEILMSGLLLPERRLRLSIAVMLAPWAATGHITNALGKLLVDSIGAQDYGVKRAGIRLITKLQHGNGTEQLIRASKHSNIDEGSRCLLAWALGGVSTRDAMTALSNLYSTSSLLSTRRVVLVAARRQSNSNLLARLTDDPDSEVSTGALRALGELRVQAAKAPILGEDTDHGG
jgi:hypothetical protein